MISRLIISVVGAPGSGKSTMIHRLRTGKFKVSYPPGVVEDCCLNFETKTGEVTVCLADGYYEGADAFIVLFDSTCKKSFEKSLSIAKSLPMKRVVFCLNKIDSSKRIITPKTVKRLARKGTTILVSCKSNYNFEKPIQFLVDEMSMPF